MTVDGELVSLQLFWGPSAVADSDRLIVHSNVDSQSEAGKILMCEQFLVKLGMQFTIV